SAWRGPDLAKHPSWIVEFTPGDLAELEAALARIKARRLSMEHVRRSDFVLPSLGPKLVAQLEVINHGRGFVVFRGLPVERYGDEDTEHILWGIGTHLGLAVTQNPRGDLLG